MSEDGPDVLVSMLPLLGLYTLGGWPTVVLLSAMTGMTRLVAGMPG